MRGEKEVRVERKTDGRKMIKGRKKRRNIAN